MFYVAVQKMTMEFQKIVYHLSPEGNVEYLEQIQKTKSGRRTYSVPDNLDVLRVTSQLAAYSWN